MALLLPGFTGSKEDFLDLQPPLAARGYRTVAVDGRGQYESDGPRDDESAYARAELVRDVLAQRDALADAGVLTAPVHLLGHSLGGQIARAAVLDSPEAFASLTLMASGPAEVSAHQRERVKMLRDALAVLDLTQVWEAMRSMEAPEDAVTGARRRRPRGRERQGPAQPLAAHQPRPARRHRAAAVHRTGPGGRAGRARPAAARHIR